MEFRLKNETGQPATGVRVMFRPSESAVLSYQVEPSVGLERADVCPYGAELQWTPAIPSGTEVVLSLEVRGELLAIQCEVWRDAGGMLQLPAKPTPDQVILYDAWRVWELATWRTLIKAVRTAMLDAIPNATAGHQFFCDLDIQTHPGLTGYTGEGYMVIVRRGKLVLAMIEVLKRRVLQRLRGALSGSAPAPAAMETWPDRDEVEEISTLQLQTYERHFSGNGGVDLDEVWNAFMQFANGELRAVEKLWGHWDGAPVSAFFFFFAEFAFMACDVGVHKARWEPLLAPMVAAQRVYTQAYRPDTIADHSLRFEDYRPGNWAPSKMVDKETKEELRARFGSLDPDELRIKVGKNAVDAFPGS